MLSNYKPMKGISNSEKKTYFKKHLFIHIKQNILPRTMEWLRDATKSLEEEDSLLNKGLNNSFLNYNTGGHNIYNIRIHDFFMTIHIQNWQYS